MQQRRMIGFFLRHLYPLRRDFDLLSDMLYWPLVDTALWGITGQWLTDASGMASLAVSIMVSLILWNVIWRAQAEISRNLIDEIWNNNLVNLFSTPLSVKEWTVGVLLLSVLKTSVTITVLLPVVFFLYSVNVFAMGWPLLVFMFLVAMTGWWIGFISAGIVLRYGPKVQTVVWTLPGALLPISAVYFPLDKLPEWLQVISRMVPTTHVFEAMRWLLINQELRWSWLGLALGLNLVYLSLSIGYFFLSFKKSRELGLGRFD